MKNKMISLICLIIFGAVSLNGQNGQLLTLAEKYIQNIKCTLTAENLQFYGLSSLESLEDYKFGPKVQHLHIRLDDLSKYTEDILPEELIKAMDYVSLPVLTKSGEMETFMLFKDIQDEYEFVGIGQDYLVQQYLELKKDKELPDDTKFIRIPALNMGFVALTIEKELFFIEIPLERRDLNPQPEPATQVLAKLADRYKNLKDLPR